ncbi:Hypothetical predicted protein [Paramuricea clavata]|uniref:Reverse transcriptase Ty1/copia-type domain-containing protein n=1 Tax=Paramuricea clavata TaxID=317549 RepID=A0A7D9MFW6_PARCT|nr:Hypothetical predicted protein [Paramuricea clavata]
MLHKYLTENNFVQSNVDHCLYIKHVDGKLVIILVWVDDLIIAARNDILMSDTKQMLKDKFHMKDLGRLSYFLGIDFKQGVDYVRMNQRKYLEKLQEKFEMSNCKPRTTPAEQKLECDGENLTDPRRKCDDDLRLIGYSDADWASSTHDRRSIDEIIEICNPVQIYEDNQGTIALSKDPVNRQRSKHIDIRYHFIRSTINAGKVIVNYCPTSDMRADIMTKAAPRCKLQTFKNFLFGV